MMGLPVERNGGMFMSSIVLRRDIERGLRQLGVSDGMAVEVHSSLHSFGYVDGGAETLIKALMQVVGSDGAIVMPSFKFSARMPLNDVDRELGLTCKIKILQDAEERSGMGIVSDTFRHMQGVWTGQGTFRVSAW